MWEGIDGTRILTHFPPSDTYCSWMSMHELMYSQRNFLDKDLSRNAILLYGFGDGGGGPTREMTARIRRDLDEFRLMLGDILRNWNVEVWRPEPGEPLEPLRCRAVRAVPTGNRDCHRTVAESLTCGYAFEGKILRPAQVVAFTYKPKSKSEEPQPPDAAAEPEADAAEVPAAIAQPSDAAAEPGTAAADAGSSTMPEMGSRAEEHPACEPPLSSSEAAAAVAQELQGTDEACGEGEAPFAGQPRCVPPAPPAPPAPRAAKAGDRLKVE